MTGSNTSSTSRRSPNIRITSWPSVPFGKRYEPKLRQGFAGALALYFLTLLVPPVSAREVVIKVIDGRVQSVVPGKQELVVTYRHPVTGDEKQLVLQVDGGTGFNENLRLQDLAKNDPVSVDYEETSSGALRAVRITRVPIRGVPKELSRA